MREQLDGYGYSLSLKSKSRSSRTSDFARKNVAKTWGANKQCIKLSLHQPGTNLDEVGLKASSLKT